MLPRLPGEWANATGVQGYSFRCWNCDAVAGPGKGFFVQDPQRNNFRIGICRQCNRPTFSEGDEQYPGVPYGNAVSNLSDEIQALYTEARRCMSVNAYTAAVLACRKILMHVAVDKGAGVGLKLIQYVEYLADNHHVPVSAKDWVDHIREKSNEANHEINVMSVDEAKLLIDFTEMLLKVVYDLPKRVPPKAPPSGSR